MLFTKQKYYENGAKCSKLLAWKLRKQQAVFKIQDSQTHTIVNKQDEIQSTLESFH